MKTVIITLFLGCLTAFAPPASQTAPITLAWDYDFAINPDVRNFKLYYSIGSVITNWDGTNVTWTNYTDSVTVGLVTNTTIIGLKWGKLYYFSATALSTNGLESDYSNQVRTNTPSKPTGPNKLTLQ